MGQPALLSNFCSFVSKLSQLKYYKSNYKRNKNEDNNYMYRICDANGSSRMF